MDHRIKTLALLFFLFLTTELSAQPTREVERCRVYYTENAQRFENWLTKRRAAMTRRSAEVYRIPVVVHVIHFGEAVGEGFNISKERIESQIRVLNEDFRRKEGTPGFNDHPDGGDAMIEFVLARSSPSGEATDGIVRVDINSKEPPPFQGNPIASGAYFSYWDPELYFNIWSFPGVADTGLGYAAFPVSDLPGLEDKKDEDLMVPGIGLVDGISITAQHFGESDLKSKYNRGRTGTHEVGHFLGLFHLWGKNVNGKPSCDVDDFCEDTPPTGAATTSCSENLKGCDGSRVMIENYMDYADDVCMNIFTQDQIARMHTVLENSPRRKSLLTSPGLNPPVTGTPDDFATRLEVYPNPVKDKLYIRLDAGYFYQNIRLTLYDRLGKVKLIQNHEQLQREELVIEMPRTNERILFLHVETGRGSFYRKLMLK